MSVAAALSSCSSDNNLLLENEFSTPHGLPPFEQIENRHYVPAFEAAIKEQKQTVALITANRDSATFTNTILPLDRSSLKLYRVASIFFNLKETDVTDTMNIIAETALPLLSKSDDEVYFNTDLFARIQQVYNSRLTSNLDSVQIRVTELYYKDFVRHGALLSPEKKDRLAKINSELSLLSHKFGTNLLDETNNSFRLVLDTVSQLSGLPDNIISAAAEKATELGLKGKWVFTLHNASIMPFLQYSDNHDLRKQIFDAYCRRGHNGGEHDNSDVVRKILTLRLERAQLLGYKNHAQYAIEENMAETPEAVDSLLQKIWPAALDKAKDELSDMKKFAYKYDKTTTIESCDWWYWAEKVRKAQYDIQDSELSPYFELNNVRKGLFACATKLYGVKFSELKDAPLYNASDNEVWQVSDADGSNLGVVYFDWHPRSTKGGGAWCTSFQNPLDNPDGSHTEAQVSIVCNFTKGAQGKPDLLTYDEVLTMFHEFGHALQSFFTKGKYVRTAGAVPGDYVEMPSQINELWAADTTVLKSFARHYETGDVIPDALLEKLRRADSFNQGFATTELLAAAILDLKWHSVQSPSEIIDIDTFEKNVFSEIGLIPEIEPRYHTTYFSHIFDGGYSAGYYDYIWADMIVCDAFAAFKETGDIFNQDLAKSFRKNCLAEVGDGNLMQQYILFRGQKPDVTYLMKHRGFYKEPKPKKVYKKPSTQTTPTTPTTQTTPTSQP